MNDGRDITFVLLITRRAVIGELVRQTLGAQGWWVTAVGDRETAVRSASGQAPQLVLVDGEIEEAAELVRFFSARHGGPGVLLLGEPAAASGSVAEGDADEVLASQPTAEDLAAAVRRSLRPAPAAAHGLPTPGKVLNARDIFGDMLLEMEQDPALGESPGATSTPPAAGGETTEQHAAESLADLGLPTGESSPAAVTPFTAEAPAPPDPLPRPGPVDTLSMAIPPPWIDEADEADEDPYASPPPLDPPPLDAPAPDSSAAPARPSSFGAETSMAAALGAAAPYVVESLADEEAVPAPSETRQAPPAGLAIAAASEDREPPAASDPVHPVQEEVREEAVAEAVPEPLVDAPPSPSVAESPALDSSPAAPPLGRRLSLPGGVRFWLGVAAGLLAFLAASFLLDYFLPAAPAGDPATVTVQPLDAIDLEELVDQELAEREAALRESLLEEERRLQKQLEEMGGDG